jgi:hypothetical protein
VVRFILEPSQESAMAALLEPVPAVQTQRYAKCVENSRRMRFDIERDVIGGRAFNFTQKFLPDGLSRVDRLEVLSPAEQRLLSQIQGRSYANIFGLVERFIAAKVLEVSRDHWLGDQVALEALVRFGDEELKHQEMFRRIERMIAAGMAEGYVFLPEPNAVASAVLGKSSWAVLALICHIELFVLAHYRETIDPDPSLSPLWKDIFLYHWREESQHAVRSCPKIRTSSSTHTTPTPGRSGHGWSASCSMIDGCCASRLTPRPAARDRA